MVKSSEHHHSLTRRETIEKAKATSPKIEGYVSEYTTWHEIKDRMGAGVGSESKSKERVELGLNQEDMKQIRHEYDSNGASLIVKHPPEIRYTRSEISVKDTRLLEASENEKPKSRILEFVERFKKFVKRKLLGRKLPPWTYGSEIRLGPDGKPIPKILTRTQDRFGGGEKPNIPNNGFFAWIGDLLSRIGDRGNVVRSSRENMKRTDDNR